MCAHPNALVAEYTYLHLDTRSPHHGSISTIGIGTLLFIFRFTDGCAFDGQHNWPYRHSSYQPP